MCKVIFIFCSKNYVEKLPLSLLCLPLSLSSVCLFFFMLSYWSQMFFFFFNIIIFTIFYIFGILFINIFWVILKLFFPWSLSESDSISCVIVLSDSYYDVMHIFGSVVLSV